jgi:antagonist of KipI
MSLRVLRPGVLTTVQDGGRHGLQHLGVVPGGAMDPVSLALANALVGNAAGEAALEITLLGPDLVVPAGTLVALCGARFDARLDGEPLPLYRPVLVDTESRLAVGRARLGSRGYLAVAGGIAAPPVLGSRSTFLPARFGGLEGRALRAGDELPLAANAAELARDRSRKSKQGTADPVAALTLPDAEPIVVRAMEGRHFEVFAPAARRAFFETAWKVSTDSNRMGYRLEGPALARARAVEILSEPTCLGTVQVPADGLPIALMADHQTTGGYPKIAEVASAEVPRLAQLKAGGAVRFQRCTLEEARVLRRELRERVAAALEKAT